MTKVKQILQIREAANFDGQLINLGMDVHKKNWNVSLYLNQNFVRSFHQAFDGQILLTHLKTNYPGGIYRACYEAGFCGFSTDLGIECYVVNAADIPQTN
jgi:transposase